MGPKRKAKVGASNDDDAGSSQQEKRREQKATRKAAGRVVSAGAQALSAQQASDGSAGLKK